MNRLTYARFEAMGWASVFTRITDPNHVQKDKLKEITAELRRAYAMELETVQNYLANSIDLDGVRAEEIKKSLGGDVQGARPRHGLGEADQTPRRAGSCIVSLGARSGVSSAAGRFDRSYNRDQGSDSGGRGIDRAIRKNYRPLRPDRFRDSGSGD